MPLPREYLSHNQIRIYIECPQKYQFFYVQELVPPINDRIALGSAFHSAVEAYFTSRLNQAEMGLADLGDRFRAALASVEAEKKVHWGTSRSETEIRGLAFLKFFYEEIAPTVRPLFCEKEITTLIPGTGIQLKGIIDLVEENFCITDFKTTTSKWSEKKAHGSLQMHIYKFLFDSLYGPVQSSLKYEILCARTADSIRRQTIVVPTREEDVERMLGIVKHVAAMIEQGVFPRSEGPHCKYCDFRAPCKKT